MNRMKGTNFFQLSYFDYLVQFLSKCFLSVENKVFEYLAQVLKRKWFSFNKDEKETKRTFFAAFEQIYDVSVKKIRCLKENKGLLRLLSTFCKKDSSKTVRNGQKFAKRGLLKQKMFWKKLEKLLFFPNCMWFF